MDIGRSEHSKHRWRLPSALSPASLASAALAPSPPSPVARVSQQLAPKRPRSPSAQPQDSAPAPLPSDFPPRAQRSAPSAYLSRLSVRGKIWPAGRLSAVCVFARSVPRARGQRRSRLVPRSSAKSASTVIFATGWAVDGIKGTAQVDLRASELIYMTHLQETRSKRIYTPQLQSASTHRNCRAHLFTILERLLSTHRRKSSSTPLGCPARTTLQGHLEREL